MLVCDGEYNFTFYENAQYTGREVMNCTDKLILCYNQQKQRADKLEAQMEKYKWVHARLRIGDLDGAWELDHVVPLDQPIPMKGKQRIWNFGEGNGGK